MNPDDTLQASEEVEVEGEEAIPARGLPSPTQQHPIKCCDTYRLSASQIVVWTLSERGTHLPHFRSKTEGQHVVPTLSVYCFFMGPSGQEEAQGVLPILALKSHGSRMTSARVVERKGPVDSTTRRRVADLDRLGLRRLVFKLDQEPAVFALKHAFPEAMPTVECVMEDGCVEEHRSNGTIEVTVREIQKNQSDEGCNGRQKCEVTFEASNPGDPRGARGNADVKVPSWSRRAHSLRIACW